MEVRTCSGDDDNVDGRRSAGAVVGDLSVLVIEGRNDLANLALCGACGQHV